MGFEDFSAVKTHMYFSNLSVTTKKTSQGSEMTSKIGSSVCMHETGFFMTVRYDPFSSMPGNMSILLLNMFLMFGLSISVRSISSICEKPLEGNTTRNNSLSHQSSPK